MTCVFRLPHAFSPFPLDRLGVGGVVSGVLGVSPLQRSAKMMIRRTVSTALIVALVAALPVPALAQAPAPDTIWGEVPAAIRASNVVGGAAPPHTPPHPTPTTPPPPAGGRGAVP